MTAKQTGKKHSQSTDLCHTYKQKDGEWSLLVVAPPKFNQLLLTHIPPFPENSNEVHALFFEQAAKKIFFEFKIVLK